jgi:EAL domain-containing protein (putative c-di-GMP-specific phosphodiesterase class I)
LLEIELTENALIHDAVYAQEVLSKLHRQGIRLSLDDFGTGYSSLSYLQNYPLTQLKLIAVLFTILKPQNRVDS